MDNVIKKLFILLSLHSPGRAGSLFFNTHQPIDDPSGWYQEPRSAHLHVQALLESMLDRITFSDLGVTPYDIPAILTPIPDPEGYYPYHAQYPYTLQRLWEKGLVPDGQLPSSYWGPVLGPHLLTIMEVMYQAMLKARSLSPSRMWDRTDIYGDIERVLQLPAGVTKADSLTWYDFKASNKHVPFLFFMTEDAFMRYDNSPNVTGLRDYEGAIDVESTSPSEDLRSRYQNQQMLAQCQSPFGSCHDEFEPVLTDMGICYAFNSIGFESTWHDSDYIQKFHQVFDPKKGDKKIEKNRGHGKGSQLFIILDSFKTKQKGSASGTFRVAVNFMTDFMDVLSDSVQLDAGFYAKITIQPLQYISSDQFKGLSRETRRCRYINENERRDSLFKFYSEKSCIYECKLRMAREKCGCTPWNYPQPGLEQIMDICDGVGAHCFQQIMSGGTENNLTKCDCLPDCERIEFETITDVHEINRVHECNLTNFYQEPDSLRNINFYRLLGEKIRFMEGEEYQVWKDRLQRTNNVDELLYANQYYRHVTPLILQDICYDSLQTDFAFLSIQLDDAVLVRMRRDKSVTIGNQIATLGGTIGLFTGMSLLGMIEIGFWLFKVATQFS